MSSTAASASPGSTRCDEKEPFTNEPHTSRALENWASALATLKIESSDVMKARQSR
eukprot:CAMPEP_0206323752 /NCGR_PEP_ID=MMETSP0106_2-20121207/20149_1 /ASSEMBLY_ACC=CAM_ASM_000206 /TAXON_ID=81532 /ORGANISM="Acanthoeca-like sp., Strain 10tr" /LENGTH=55 /DNA_ID=CAMNT_0053756057 /DNA_START=16 /DNA_END=179 /DNA_ORIENTATION=+